MSSIADREAFPETLSVDDWPSIWRPGCAPADVDQRQFSELVCLLQGAISQAAQELPEILKAPEGIRPAHLRDRIRRYLAISANEDSAENLDRQTILFNLLEECLLKHPELRCPITTVRAYRARNLFPSRPDKTLPHLGQINAAVWRWLKTNAVSDEFDQLNCDAKVGLFLTALVLRQALCSTRILAAVARSLDQPLRIAGEWAYLHITIAGDPKNPPEKRRIFLDVATAALFLRIPPDGVDHAFPPDIRELKTHVAQRKHNACLNRCYRAFTDVIRLNGGFQNMPRSLSALCEIRLDGLRLQVSPVLSEYAEAALQSTSFNESAWLRWLGRQNAKERDNASAPIKSGLSDWPKEMSESLSAKVIAADFDAAGELPRIRAAIRQSTRELRGSAINSVVEHLHQSYGKNAPETLLARWVERLLTQPRPGGRYLSPRTVKYMTGIFGARMLASFRSCAGTVPNEEELHDVYLEILEQATSSGLETRLASVIRDFDLFLREEMGWQTTGSIEGLPTATAHYQISANALTPSEFKRVYELTTSPGSTISDPQTQKIARSVVALAFRLGMRRSEILGLMRGDVHLGRRPELIVRENSFRGLKTRNARRRVPAGLLERKELGEFTELLTHATPASPAFRRATENIPIADHLVMPHVKGMLLEVTKDPAVHFHHLRHSAASWSFFALMADQIPLKRYLERAPFLKEVVALGDGMARCLVSPFHPLGSRAYASCDLLGHGSPLTTLRHYIHVLDLLLFMSVDPSESRGNQQIELAALGFGLNSRLTEYQPTKSLRSLIASHGDRVVAHPLAPGMDTPADLAADSTELDFEAVASTWAEAVSQQVTVDGLCPANSGLAIPSEGAARRAAVFALQALNAALATNEVAARRALVILGSKLMSNSDWSSVTGEHLTAIAAALDTPASSGIAQLDIKSIEYGPARKRKLVSLTSTQALKKLRQKRTSCRFWVRVHDRRPRSSRKRPDHPDRLRQRTQRAVTWVVYATAFQILERDVPR